MKRERERQTLIHLLQGWSGGHRATTSPFPHCLEHMQSLTRLCFPSTLALFCRPDPLCCQLKPVSSFQLILPLLRPRCEGLSTKKTQIQSQLKQRPLLTRWICRRMSEKQRSQSQVISLDSKNKGFAIACARRNSLVLEQLFHKIVVTESTCPSQQSVLMPRRVYTLVSGAQN